MAQTTTAINACSAVIEIDNAGGTPVDISGSSNTANMTLTREIAEGNTFEGASPFRLECKLDGSLELTVMWTTAIGETEGRHLLETWYTAGGQRTVLVYPNGTATGERVYSGEFLLEELSFPLDGSAADPIIQSASLLPSGGITLGTAP
jgi:hypothetical protein